MLFSGSKIGVIPKIDKQAERGKLGRKVDLQLSKKKDLQLSKDWLWS